MGSLLSCCGTNNTNDTEPGYLRPQTRPAKAKASIDNGGADENSTQEVITRQVGSPAGINTVLHSRRIPLASLIYIVL